MSELLLTPHRTRVRLEALASDGVVLEADGRQMVLEAWPDERSAQRVGRLATRLLAVEFFDLDGLARAELTAVWHRVPHTRPVSLAAALAFTVSGVPAFVSDWHHVSEASR